MEEVYVYTAIERVIWKSRSSVGISQLEGGELALRNAGSEKEPLVKIQFSDELKAILGEQTPIVAQHMIQAALFGLLEKQVNEWQAEVVDEQPKFLS